LPGIGPDTAQRLRQDRLYFDVFSDRPAQHRLGVTDDGVEIHDPGRQHLLSAEREQLTRQRARALPGAHDLMDQFTGTLVVLQ